MELHERLNTSQAPMGPNDPFAEVKSRVHFTVIGDLGPQLYNVSMDPEDLRERVLADVRDQLAQETGISRDDRQRIALEVTDDILGHGPLERLLADESVTEIMVNGPYEIWIERGGRLYPSDVVFNDEWHLRRIINKMVAQVGRRIDESSPMADARAVGQAGVGHRRRLVDAATDARDDARDDLLQVRVVAEADRRQLQLAEALDVTGGVAVDHDVGDGRVGEQRLQRPQAGDLVQQLLDHLLALDAVQREIAERQQLVQDQAQLVAQLFARQLLDGLEVNLLDQLLVKLVLQLVVRVGGLPRQVHHLPGGRRVRAGRVRAGRRLGLLVQPIT